MSIRIGVQLHPQHCTMDDLMTAAGSVEDLGVDTVWTWDHFFPLYGGKDTPQDRSLPKEADPRHKGAHFEAWVTLTALACETRKVELGHLVTCNTYRNPDLLADMARTLDHVSHGRAILGIGAGWFEKDYEEYGYEYRSAGKRLAALEDGLQRIQARLKKLNPPPKRKKLPILIGGGGEKVTLRLVATYADMANFFGDPDEWGRKNDILNDWCRQVGRDPQEIERTTLLMSPEAMEQLDAYVEKGVQHFILGMGTPFDLAPVKKLLAWRGQTAGVA